MAPATALAAVRSALAAGADHLALTFFGGEPLLRADALFEVLAGARGLARDRGVPVTAKTSTNGLLLDESVLARAAATGLFISLSFDGVPAAQDAGRVKPDGSGSFADAERALRRLVAFGRPFGVYSVVTPANVRYLAESRRFLWDAGARILVTAIDYTSRWTEADARTLVAQYERVGEMYRELLRNRRHFHLEPFDSRIAQRTRGGEWTRCFPGISQVTVAPDGTLYGCVEFAYRRLDPIGTAEGWLDRDRVKAFASARLAGGGRAPECQSCGVRDRCNNTCACVNLRTTGAANRPPESLCLTEQETILAIDRLAARLYKQRVLEFLLRQYSSSFHLLSTIESLFSELGVDHEPATTVPDAPVAAPAAE